MIKISKLNQMMDFRRISKKHGYEFMSNDTCLRGSDSWKTLRQRTRSGRIWGQAQATQCTLQWGSGHVQWLGPFTPDLVSMLCRSQSQ